MFNSQNLSNLTVHPPNKILQDLFPEPAETSSFRRRPLSATKRAGIDFYYIPAALFVITCFLHILHRHPTSLCVKCFAAQTPLLRNSVAVRSPRRPIAGAIGATAHNGRPSILINFTFKRRKYKYRVFAST